MASDFNVDDALKNITLRDKIKLLSGIGWWNTYPVPGAGIQSMRMSDGPNGVRGSQFFNGVPSNCFPSSTGLGSSFDVELAHKVGIALGKEAHAKGCHILLAPTVNTQRSPLGGRSFESFSEDPHLNGYIAAAYINGVQSTGISATIKHYVANDQEFQRFSISSDVSERALREIYLKPFQIAIKKSNPWALMSAYNRVNGLHVSEDPRLLNDILRREWGYQGMIMSDWTGVYSTSASMKAGLDLEMPGPTVMRGRAVERALVAGKLSPSNIDERVRKILELYKHALASEVPFNAGEKTVDTPEIRQLLRTAAADAIVLLKNQDNVLPLKPGLKKIAIIGPNAKRAMTSGITSAAKEIGAEVQYAMGTTTHTNLPVIDPYIKQQNGDGGAMMEFWNHAPSEDFLKVGCDLQASLAPSVWSTPTHSADCFLADGVDDTKVNEVCFIRYTTQFIPDEDGDWEFSLNLAGAGNLFLDGELLIDLSTNPQQGQSFFGLGTVDMRATAERLKANQSYNLEVRVNNAAFVARGSPFTCWGGVRIGGVRRFDVKQGIAEAVQLAKESDAAILVVGLNHDWESEGFDRQDLQLPGATDALVSNILQANPNTVVVNQSGAPVVMPWAKEAKAIVQAFYGGNELGHGMADVLFGKVNPSGKLSLTFPDHLEDCPSFISFGDKGQEFGKILYNEGIFVGYRGYEYHKIVPLFPFGHGLSYTTFMYSDLKTSEISPDAILSVSFTLTNTGKIAGREVAQIYVTDSECSLPRPKKELKGFTKIGLDAGESKTVGVDLDRDAFAFYDDRRNAWVAEAGAFTIHIGASSKDIKLSTVVELKDTLSWAGL